MSERFCRTRPDWYALVFQYGVGIVVAWQLLDDLWVQHWKVYSGEFYPWRRMLPVMEHVPVEAYWLLVGAEVVLLALYFARVRTRPVAFALAGLLFVDGLASFLNHRLLMAIELFLVGLMPVPADARQHGFRAQRIYWNLDLVRFQLGLIYATTAVHKMSDHFLSGQALWNLFWHLQREGLRDYPPWLFEALQDMTVCSALAWATVGTEFVLAVTLQFRRSVGWVLVPAIVMHLAMAALMPFIWMFTAQLAFAMVAFLPNRVRAEAPVRLRGCSSRVGPKRFLRVVWPGTVVDTGPDEAAESWSLELPGGDTVRGYDAWIELLSLSPLTFLFAEVGRIPPLRALGRRLLRPE